MFAEGTYKLLKTGSLIYFFLFCNPTVQPISTWREDSIRPRCALAIAQAWPARLWSLYLTKQGPHLIPVKFQR